MPDHDDCPRCPVCGEHRHGGECEDPGAPVPGGPPMRDGNNPRTGIAYND